MRPTSFVLKQDTNKTYYQELNLGVLGLSASGISIALQQTFTQAYGETNVFFMSKEAPKNDENKQEAVTNPIVEDLVDRLFPYKKPDNTVIEKWFLKDKNGIPLTYEIGEKDNLNNPINGNIELLMGIRVVKFMDHAIKLNMDGTSSVINHILVMCWFNHKIRVGYVDIRAFRSQGKRNRTYIRDRYTIENFLNDAWFEIYICKNLSAIYTDNKFSTFVNHNNYVEAKINDLIAFCNIKLENQIKISDKIISFSKFNTLKYIYNSNIILDTPKTISNYLSIESFKKFIRVNKNNFTVIAFSEKFINDILKNPPNENKFKDLLSDLQGNSGSGQHIEVFPEPFVEFKNLITEDTWIDPLKKIRFFSEDQSVEDFIEFSVKELPETKWLKKIADYAELPFIGLNNISIDNLQCLIYISSNAWDFSKETIYADSIGIDQSFGFIDSIPVLSILYHEFNVSPVIEIISIPTDTHSLSGALPTWKFLNENSTFINAKSFDINNLLTIENVSGIGLDKGKHFELLNDLFQRNAVLGIMYLDYWIENLLSD